MTVRKVLCRLDDIPDSGAVSCEINGDSGRYSVILLRRGDIVYAYYNECPHAGRRLDWAPGKFLLESGRLICAAHGASFLIDSGKCDAGPCRGAGLMPIKIQLEDGEVQLK